MRNIIRKATYTALLPAVACLAVSSAKADVIPSFDVATAVAGGTQFSYSAALSSGSKLFTNDYFTIYDFAGYVAGSAFAPVGWTFTVQKSGITPGGQLLVDDPNVDNITFKYIGAATVIGPVNPIGGPSAFGAISIYSVPKAGGVYASQTHKNNPGRPDNNTLQGNQGVVVTPAAVPEGSSLAMWGAGLLPLGMLARRRRRS